MVETIKSDNSEQDRFSEIKKNIENSYEYFKENADRYHAMRRFIFYSTLTEDDKMKLMSLGKPVITANVMEAYLSRMRGNFLNNEPSISVENKDCVPSSPIREDQIDFLDCHLREVLANPDDDSFQYQVYTDTMSGGYSYAEVYTKYISERSWEQEICVEKEVDPTMCGCDPLAKESHKGDGEYVFRLVPLTRQQFIEKYGKGSDKDIVFSSARSVNMGNFKWAYKNANVEIVLVAEYYWKKRKEQTLYRLSDGRSATKKEYDKIIADWELSDSIELPPIIVQERKETFITIMKDEVCQTKILESTETIFSKFPLIFCDGNSQILKDTSSPGMTQVTRPWLFHAEGAQRLKDFSMQTAAAEIENMIMSKLMAPVEGLPQDEALLKAYTNYQQSSVVTYNAYDLDDPTKQLPEPREIQRTPTPPIVMESFMACDRLIQQVSGDYDLQPSLDRDISGETIKQGALQTSEAAKPYMKSFNMFLQRVGEVIIDIIPKIYTTPRTLPVRGLDGKRGYQVINDPNDPNSLDIQYDPSGLKITVQAGASVAAQQQIGLQQLAMLSETLPSFRQWLDQEAGAELIELTDIKSKDRMKEQYNKWMEENKQNQQQMAQQAQQAQQALMQAEIQKLVAEAMKAQSDAQTNMKKADDAESQFVAKLILEEQIARENAAIGAAKVAVDQEKVQLDSQLQAMKIQIEAQQAQLDSFMRAQEIDAENARTAVESAIAVDRHFHDKNVDIATLENDRKKQEKPKSE